LLQFALRGIGKNIVIAFTLVLAGCVTTVPELASVDTPAWQARQVRITALENWELSGRVVLQTKKEGWHLNLNWKRQAQQQQLDLAGPLNKGHIRVEQDRDQVILIDANQRQYTSDTIQNLIYETTGWLLPIESLVYWVRGIPEPASINRVQLDEQGRLRYLEQSGWFVEYANYVAVNGHDLPDRIFLTRSATAANHGLPTVKVKLAVNQWRLDKPGSPKHH